MLDETLPPREPLPACGARVPLLAGVHCLVFCQLGLEGKPPVTHGAWVWLLSRVPGLGTLLH